MWFRNVALVGLMFGAVFVLASCGGGVKGPLVSHPVSEGWESVVADDLSNCEFNPGSWAMEDGVLTWKKGGSIWTKEQYGDFILDLEFKVDKGTNSGVFFRTADIKNPVQTGIEIQIHDSHGREPGKHSCGAVYDIQKPSVNSVKPAGEWNRMTIMAKGPNISIVMNDEQIIDIDLDNWTEARKNPDGTPNKFKTAYKDAARVGAFGFQDHGKPVWYRNIRVKKL
ncbi:MAG: 3-keto-disaccharide hydrolase [Planctomycetota bacterium]|jgi:hypothetical protein